MSKEGSYSEPKVQNEKRKKKKTLLSRDNIVFFMVCSSFSFSLLGKNPLFIFMIIVPVVSIVFFLPFFGSVDRWSTSTSIFSDRSRKVFRLKTEDLVVRDNIVFLLFESLFKRKSLDIYEGGNIVLGGKVFYLFETEGLVVRGDKVFD